LPALVGAKNQAACAQPTNTALCAAAGGTGQAATGYRGAHIVWDGLIDKLDEPCPFPKDANGNPVPQDADGKPLHTNEHPDPACHYNAYKFDLTKTGKPRKLPAWWYSCIDANNVFAPDSLAFSNFNGTKGVNAALKAASGQQPNAQDVAELQSFPSSFDRTPHNCQAQYGSNMPTILPVVIPPFVRTGQYDPAPAQAEIDRLCNAPLQSGVANFEAGKVNCPNLASYNLFSNPEDPTSTPNSAGVPYAMNSKLFSDYSVKYRVLYIPPGTKAVYRDNSTDGANAVIVFPVGTIIAKSFAFDDQAKGTENMIETRLLIKRVGSNNQARWQGMTYQWTTENGKRVAKLALGGGMASVSWDHTDVDSGVRHTGSTSTYRVPNVNQCLACHSREDQEPGSAPIGPKVRFMNRPYAPESGKVSGQGQHPVRGKNQIEYLCSNGFVIGCPSDLAVNPTTQIAAKLEKAPVFNVPGSSGFAANSNPDIEARARAWLEVNCAHCHNVRGFASNTGFYLDAFRKVDATFGVCKLPTAAGTEGKGGRTYDLHPANAADSIMLYRISAEATVPAAKMPPIARSVVDTEGAALIQQWINTVTKVDTAQYPNSDQCK
jgi:uncharacterized repeat protein (TIGR03806 family)